MFGVIIGIDPGFNKGAVALVNGSFAEVHDLPVIEGFGPDVHALADLLSGDGITHAFVERVGPMPKQGVSSVWKFAQAVGAIHAAVALSGVPMTLVTPQAWKKHHKLMADKEAARQRALQLFPALAAHLALKKHADRAEALLIAQFGLEAQNVRV